MEHKRNHGDISRIAEWDPWFHGIQSLEFVNGNIDKMIKTFCTSIGSTTCERESMTHYKLTA